MWQGGIAFKSKQAQIIACNTLSRDDDPFRKGPLKYDRLIIPAYYLKI